MGCDCHWFLEARRPAPAGGVAVWDCIAVKYVTDPTDEEGNEIPRKGQELKLYTLLRDIYADRKATDPAFDAKLYATQKGGWHADQLGKPKCSEFLSDRNYDLFALLANVRNEARGHPEFIEPLKKGAGDLVDVAPDASELVKLEVEHWGMDAHSFVAYTLAELDEHVGPPGSDKHIARVLLGGGGRRDYDYTADLVEFIGRMRKIVDAEHGGDATALRLVIWFDN